MSVKVWPVVQKIIARASNRVIVGLPKQVFLSDRGAHYCAKFGFPEGYCFSIAIAVGNNTVTKEAHPIGEGKVNLVL